MKVIYEGAIGGYSFLMVDKNTIEVWTDMNNDAPHSFIFLRSGEVLTEKQFQVEIMDWFSKNCN